MRTPRARNSWDLEGDPRFELRRALGSGNFGSVYEVFDRERGARVALKLLDAITPEEIYRFKQEFRALADMAHPNLVRLYELISDGDRWFFTMELIEGTNVLAFVRRGHSSPDLLLDDGPREPAIPPANHDAGARFDEARLRSVLRQLVEGLSALHEGGKVHRDVKPGNVLVTTEGRVALVDFGLAARLSASGEISRSTLVGTPAYLAPELVRGEPASVASDWYAVGVLLYEALTGRPPFIGTLERVLSDKLAGAPPAPSVIADGVPPDLDELCVSLLSRHPAERPGGHAILERVGGAAASRSGSHEIPFVGRANERATVADLFGAVMRDRTAAIALVGGPSGIGKSALVDRVCADICASSSSTVVLAGRCWEQESVPYKAIDGLVDPLSRHLKAMPTRAVAALLPAEVRTLARLFPALDQVEAIAHAPAPVYVRRDAHDLRRAAFRALRELLGNLAKSRHLVLVIDDLQWGDPDSGALLIELLAPPDPPPVTLIVSYRSDEAETSACLRAALPALRAMDGDAVRVASIELGALTEADACALARALTGREDIAAAVAREAGGRPFFIRELAEQAKGHDMRGAPSLDALVRDRVAALPDRARWLLEILAVAGRPVHRAAAARAADLGDGQLEAYEALRAAKLVRRRDADERDEIEPYHDRIRQAVADGLAPELRREAFQRLATALDEDGGADPETLATYYQEAGYLTRSIELFMRAAEDASRQFAFDRAARLYRRALHLRDPDGPRDAETYEALAEALVNTGRAAEAAEAFARAAEGASRDHAFELRQRAAEHMLLAGRMDKGTVALRRCVSELGLSYPETMWQIVLGILVGVAWLSIRGFGFRERAASEVPILALRRIDTFLTAARAFATTDTLRGARFCVAALRMALRAGEPRRVFDALATFRLLTLGISGRLPAVLRRAGAAADALADRLEGTRAQAKLHVMAGAAAVMSGELVAGRAALAKARALFETDLTGAIWETNLMHEFTCMALFWSGSWGELRHVVADALEDARARGNQYLDRNLSLRFGHVAALLADDPERAERVNAEACAGWWPDKFSTLDHFAMLSKTDIKIYIDHGVGVGGHEIVQAAWPHLEASQILRVEKMSVYPLNLRARAAIAASGVGSERERRAKLAIAEDAARRVGNAPTPLAKALAALLEAGISAARGDDRRARDGFARAATMLEAVDCAHYAAAAKRRHGLLVGGDDGRALVAEADDRLRAAGARNPARLAAMLSPSAT